MVKSQSSEKGQVLVLIILAIVGMMGFAALAVDLGRLYAERRRAQSAVDAAAMAAAYAYAANETFTVDDAYNAAWTVLGENDYFDVDPVVITLVTPPESGPYADTDEGEFFQVKIDTSVNPIFAQFVYRGNMPVSVEAVAHAMPTQGISPGNAMTATRRDTCPGIVWNGNIETNVNGGNVFSNAEGTNHGNCYSAITTGASGQITVVDGEVRVANQFNGHNNVDPPVVEGVGFETFPPVPEPYCDDLPVGAFNTTTRVVAAGRHPTVPNGFKNGDWTLAQGMHCFYDNLDRTGGSLRSSGYGTFIVMKQGGIKFGGNTNVKLRAIFAGPDGNGYIDGEGNQWSGMLIYMSPGNTNGLDLSGNSGTSYTGTIYAPGPRNPTSQEKCNVGGTGDSYGLHAALICSTIGVAGSSDVSIIYRENENYRPPPAVELTQ